MNVLNLILWAALVYLAAKLKINLYCFWIKIAIANKVKVGEEQEWNKF